MNVWDITLTFLRYLGLTLAAFSSIWSATNVVSKEVDGKKQLTKAGKTSIGLTLAGLLISITSSIVQDYNTSIKSEKSITRELKRTNRIILSSQPLGSMQIVIAFDTVLYRSIKGDMARVDTVVYTEILNTVQGEASGDQTKAIELEIGLFPTINYLISGAFEDGPVKNFLLLFALDDVKNSVLSYGFLNDSITSYRQEVLPIKSDNEKLSEGLTFQMPSYYTGAKQMAHPYFQSKPGVFKWDLDPATLVRCLNKQVESMSLTANLPNTFKIAILFDFNSLPFNGKNVATCSEYGVWIERNTDTDGGLKRHVFKNSQLVITPNGNIEQSARYQFKNSFEKSIYDPGLNEDFICNELILVYQRIEE